MVYMLPLATVIKHFRCVKCVLEKWEQSYHCTNGDEKKQLTHTPMEIRSYYIHICIFLIN